MRRCWTRGATCARPARCTGSSPPTTARCATDATGSPTRPTPAKPELLAERPNELWSWDISKLKGPAKWTYYYLYVILDVFSRYVVGWTVQYRESGQVTKDLIEQATEQQQITPEILTLHADRGGPMRSKPLAFLLADLGITKTHSRPYTSSDNPYSEAHFKTLKYRPAFPARFDNIEHAREHCRVFFDYYNHQHRHSGIGLMTPVAMHHGTAPELHQLRARVLDAAYTEHPERFVRKPPVPPELPTAAWINTPNTKEVAAHQIRTRSVSPSLTGSGRASVRGQRCLPAHAQAVRRWHQEPADVSFEHEDVAPQDGEAVDATTVLTSVAKTVLQSRAPSHVSRWSR